MGLPSANPIDAGWMPRGSPVDHLGPGEEICPGCKTVRQGERYRVIMGRWFGFGAPYFVQPFLKRTSTAGKTGQTSNWWVCATCRAMVPQDDLARRQALELGSPNGLGVLS